MAAGVLGAGTGAIATLAIDNRAEKRQRREEKRSCYAQLISDYKRFMSEVAITPELIDEIPPEKERDLFTQFQITHSSALLICGKNSVEPLAEFSNQILEIHLRRTTSGLHDAYMSALKAMRRELAD